MQPRKYSSGSPKTPKSTNLKEMLAYYNERKTPFLEEQKSKHKIIDYQDIHTEELMLPFPNRQHFTIFPRHQSDMLIDNNERCIRQANSILHLQRFDKQFQRSGSFANIFTRTSLSQMNKRQRNIRTSHYKTKARKNSVENIQKIDEALHNNDILTGKKVSQSSSTFNRDMIFSSYAHRAINHMMSSAPNSERAQSPMNSQNGLGITSESKLKIRVYQGRSGQKYQKKHNPIVVYPFESKLKTKKIDDNPKVLSNIIRKKCKLMEKDQLYGYINGLIRRRLN